jgi:replicative DNA helicase
MNEQEQNTLKLEAEPFDYGFTDMSKLIPNVFDRMIKKIEKPEAITGISTCFPSFDYYISGLQRGDLIVVAGRPSMGKRFFVRDIATHVALVNNLPVVMMDGEKSGEFQVMDMIASMAKTDYYKLYHSKTTQDAVDHLKNSFSFLNDAPIYFS